MEQFTKAGEMLATLFFALGFLVFFGPIITIVSIIGKIKLGLIEINLSERSKFTRFILGTIGFGVWLAIYIPLVSLAFKVIPQTATATATEIPILIIAQPTETSFPSIISTSTLLPIAPDPNSIVITEVSGNPCGDNPRNEFIELYNISENPINVDGWWFTDGDESEKIVSWESRYPTVKIGFMTQINTAIIPPHGYAVILAAGYPFVQGNFIMPYIFPENTLILTTENGELLGDETYGIEVSNRDIVVLYHGNKASIDKFISSYGSPTLSSSPTAIKDNGADAIPFDVSVNNCWSVERVIPINEDIESNWKTIISSSPGSGNYP